MIGMRRLGAPLAAAVVAAGCGDVLRPAAPAAPAELAIAASLAFSGGTSEAYQKVNQLSVRVLASDAERLARVVAFDPSASQTVVSLQVPLEESAETFSIELELRTGAQPLFRGTGTAELSAGGVQQVEIPIAPVVSSVTCGAPAQFTIAVYRAARRITAAALFASGDTVPGVAIAWSSSDANVVTIDQAGNATGQRDGQATITCSAQGVSGSRTVVVRAAIAAIDLQPAPASLVVGGTVTFTATGRDSLGNAISPARAATWVSSAPAIVNVTQAGVATALAAGTATLTVTIDGLNATRLLTVLAPPAVATAAATGVGGSTATLNGSVNPQGQATTAWFEWGTAADLAGAASTPAQQAGSGTTGIALSQPLANLLGNQRYYFRAVASSPAGTVRGAILSFTTTAPPTVRTISGTPVLSGASLQGGVDPQGLATQAWFEWSLSPSLAGAQQTPVQNLAAGRGEVPTSASLTNLSPGITYYFRAAASNSVGTTYGQVLSVQASQPPAAATLAATAITSSDATLQATVNPNGQATSAYFEWAAGRAPTTFNSTAPQALGAGTQNLNVAQLLTGLQPSTLYSFRIVASSAIGTTRGSLQTFSTLTPPVAVTLDSYYYNFGAGTISYPTGEIAPSPYDTEVWFEYSTTSPTLATYSSTAIQVIPVGGQGEAGYQFYDAVAGVIYFRAVARNAGGISRGVILRTHS